MDGKIKELKPEKSGPTNLRQKLCAVMADMETVEMSGFNRAQNYKYLMAKDVILAARRALSKHGVAFMATEEEITSEKELTTRSGAVMNALRLRMKFSFLDSDSEERIDVVATGEGQDTGDKAVYKARTGAIKYALQNTLLIAAGDDPEDDKGEEEHTASRPAPQSRPVEMVKDRMCPSCGKPLIYKRNEQQWQCWRSKGGCESTFSEADLVKAEEAKADLRRSESEIPTPPPAEDNGGRTSEKIVATDAQLKELYDLIAQATDPELTTKNILSQCGVEDLADLIPKQVEWLVGSLTSKLQARGKKK